ncbi:MAG: PKD domain-containing protein, partial [candidate division Zixibacteria bacterium]|nr:PKD domain-containing protein [candidate division Zixibacteria bacterium]
GTDTLTKAAYIHALPPKPVASFTGTPTSGEAPLSVDFTSTSTGSITFYEWDFGDGDSSGLQNPTHIYSVPGVYDVRLKVTGLGGADSSTVPDYITVNIPRPVAQFTLNPDSGLAPLDVQFTNTSTGTITSYAWDFGDGATTLQENPFHSYEQPGIYDVRLIVSGPGGTDTSFCVACVTVIAPPPVAAFDAAPTSGVAPLNVQFNNLSTGTITTYEWDFGDGDSASVRNPGHTYMTPGLYTVTLREIGPGGEDTLQRVDYISVAIPPPTADFSGAPQSGTVPLAVTFTNNSSGAITGYQWDFGDGGGSILENPAYVYQDTGLFSVTLIVTGPGGADTLTRVDYITALVPPPVAEFTADITGGAAPLDVQFTDLSTGDITTYEWDFGDSTTSADQSPLHSYSSPGVYTVKLTVTGSGGTHSITKVDYISVASPGP